MNGTNWPIWTTTTTATNTVPVILTAPATNYTYSYGSGGAGGGHIPAYDPPSLAEDELAWLRRRITEVTDLFPVAA